MTRRREALPAFAALAVVLAVSGVALFVGHANAQFGMPAAIDPLRACRTEPLWIDYPDEAECVAANSVNMVETYSNDMCNLDGTEVTADFHNKCLVNITCNVRHSTIWKNRTDARFIRNARNITACGVAIGDYHSRREIACMFGGNTNPDNCPWLGFNDKVPCPPLADGSCPAPGHVNGAYLHACFAYLGQHYGANGDKNVKYCRPLTAHEINSIDGLQGLFPEEGR